MRKIAIFALNGDSMYFIHVLLNALDMANKGFSVKLIIEGNATALLNKLADPGAQLAQLYNKVKEQGLIDCVCNACAEKTGSIDSAREQDLPLCAEMKGHPSMARYMDEGYEIITF